MKWTGSGDGWVVEYGLYLSLPSAEAAKRLNKITLDKVGPAADAGFVVCGAIFLPVQKQSHDI